MTLRLPTCEACGEAIWPVPHGRRPRQHQRCRLAAQLGEAPACGYCGRQEVHNRWECRLRAARSTRAVRKWMASREKA